MDQPRVDQYPPAPVQPQQAQQRQTATASTREELRAIITTRRDLGPEYEDALVDSFLDKLDVEIAARVRNEVAAQMRHQHAPAPAGKRDGRMGVALGSLAMGIPLTAIAADYAGGPGMLLAWGGIIAVNVTFALSRRSQR